jgi:hypothetical protein
MLGAGERTSNAYPLAPKGVGEAAKFFFASRIFRYFCGSDG